LFSVQSIISTLFYNLAAASTLAMNFISIKITVYDIHTYIHVGYIFRVYAYICSTCGKYTNHTGNAGNLCS